MKIRIPKVVKHQRFRQKYISNSICRLPYIDFFLEFVTSNCSFTTEDNELKETGGAKDFELINKLNEWFRHSSHLQTKKITCLSLPFGCLLSWDPCLRFDIQAMVVG